METSESLEERREQGGCSVRLGPDWEAESIVHSAKVAFLNTLAAAQRNPNGKELVEHLTRLLGGMEGLGGDDMTPEDFAKGFAQVPDVSIILFDLLNQY